ncbi:MAG: HAD hydrolase-like protein [Candidatus Krumholzibacteriia bacterium]
MNRPLYLIDVEGVLVVDKSYRPVAGSVAWLNGLGDRGIRWRLVSNNTTHRPDELVAALNDAGFVVPSDHLSGALTTGLAQLQREGWRRLNWLGAHRLRGWLREQGFSLTDESTGACDAVVLGVSPELTLGQLDRAMTQLREGAVLMCLHRNRFWLDRGGRPRLGPGALAAALLAAVPGARCLTAGKPEPAVYQDALKSLGGKPADALFISDDPFTDLVGARQLGIATVFVLSGKYQSADVLDELPRDQRPDLVLQRADQLSQDHA